MMPDKENNGGCSYGRVTRTMLLGLEKKFDTFYNNDFGEAKKTLREIRNKLNNPHPSWATTTLITILSSLSTGLIVAKLIGG